jgi:hypothetical protein
MRQFKISCNIACLRSTIDQPIVFLHTGIRLDDLVEVESRANLDVPCDSGGVADQFLWGVPMKNFQFSAIRVEADRIRNSPWEREFPNDSVQISNVRR